MNRESNSQACEVTDSNYLDLITKQIQAIALEIENLPGSEAREEPNDEEGQEL